MPKKKSIIIPGKTTLYLHCKCEDCTHWELVATVSEKDGDRDVTYALVCKTCGETVPVNFLGLEEAHPAIHWGEKDE